MSAQPQAQYLTSLIDLPLTLQPSGEEPVSLRLGRPFKIPMKLISRAQVEVKWAPPHALMLSYRWYDENGVVLDVLDQRTTIPAPALDPMSMLPLQLEGVTPAEAGNYRLQASLILEQVHWACDVGPTGWVDIDVSLLPALHWPAEWRASPAAKALRGALASADLARSLRDLAGDPAQLLPVATMVVTNEEKAPSGVEQHLSPGPSGPEEVQDLMEHAVSQQKRITELLLALNDRDRTVEDLREKAARSDGDFAEQQKNFEVQQYRIFEEMRSHLGALAQAQKETLLEVRQGDAVVEVIAGIRQLLTWASFSEETLTSLRQLIAWTETTSDISKISPIDEHVTQVRDLVAELIRNENDVRVTLDASVHDITRLISERHSEQRVAMDVQHDKTLLKLDSLIQRQVVPVPHAKLMLIRNFAGILAVQDDDLQAIAYYSSGTLPEPGTIAVVQKLLKPGNVVFDVGANVGMYSLLTARLVGPGGKVIAFEPTPSTLGALHASVALNGLSRIVQIEPVALGSEVGSAFLHCEATSGHNSLLSVGSASKETYEVPVRRGADFLAGGTPDLIKIDVEGWELDVLTGFGELVGNGKTVFVIEYSPEHVERRGWSKSEWLSRLRGFGLRLWKINDQDGTLADSPALADFGGESFNLLLARKLPSTLTSLQTSMPEPQ